ncbi:MAG: hypothetical protein Q7J78_01980 [Clostridiales bacterium]|nr:hypothetical protein [Clostridiales bacterium]
MTSKEQNLRIFKKDDNCGVLWQPRLNNWFQLHSAEGTHLERHYGKSILEVHDNLCASIRAYMYFRKAFYPVYDKNLTFCEEDTPKGIYKEFRTPFGILDGFYRKTREGFCWEKHYITNPEEIKIMQYILEGVHYVFDMEIYSRGCEAVGERCAEQTMVPRIGFQEINVNLMGLENATYAFFDYPEQMERLQETINKSYDTLFEAICSSPISIVNFGDNIHCDLTPPPTFERYILPWYQKRTGQLRNAGKYSNAHWDGSVKTLLKYAKLTGLDGIEAITPLPQGDVTIEETAEELKDMILLDGIPAIYFLKDFDIKVLEDYVHNIIELFKDRLILGISDEMPGDGDIERVAFVSGLVEKSNRRKGYDRKGKGSTGAKEQGI